MEETALKSHGNASLSLVKGFEILNVGSRVSCRFCPLYSCNRQLAFLNLQGRVGTHEIHGRCTIVSMLLLAILLIFSVIFD